MRGPVLDVHLNILWQLLAEDHVALVPQIHRGKGADHNEFTETSGLTPDYELGRQHSAPRVTEDVVSRIDAEVLDEIDKLVYE